MAVFLDTAESLVQRFYDTKKYYNSLKNLKTDK